MTEFQIPDVPVRTTVPGAEIQIGKYGKATNTEPCWVPAHVAQELSGLPEYQVGQPGSSGGPIVDEDPSRSQDEPSEGESVRPKRARKGQEG